MATMSDKPSFLDNSRDDFQGVWLDRLPLDVCASIASFLKPKQLDPWELRSNNGFFHEFEARPTSIPLAAVSRHQRRAVEAAQAHQLHFENTNASDTQHLVQQWRRILRADVREVHLAIDLDNYRDFHALLAFPAVLKATAPCVPSLMTALINGGTVQKLQLHLMRSFTGGLQLLPTLLASCPVKELRLVCHQCDSFMGARTGCATLSLDAISGSATVPSLTSLHIVCTSARAETLMRAMPFFPNLRELSLQRWEPVEEIYVNGEPTDTGALQVTREFKECLQSLTSVGMMHYGNVDSLVPVLRERLTKFSCHTKLSMKDVRRLEACPNLKALEVVLADGAETGFPIGMCALQSLSLRWGSDPRKDVHYTPDADSLTRLLAQNTSIEELHLHSAQLETETLHKILATTARAMRVLEVPIFKQGICPLARFLDLIRALITHEIRLTQLEADITSGSVNATDLRDHDASSCARPECVFCSFPKSVCHAAAVLRRRMPGLRLDGLERLRLVFAAW